MSEEWTTVTARDIPAGARVRLPSGDELTATRVDRDFMGMDSMVAVIEDTPERWHKQPLPVDAEVEVQREAPSISDHLLAHRGKALLIVNVASKCGLTPHYEGLQRIHERYADQGFSVIGFPCNQFGGQEPGTQAEIEEFCSTTYAVTFPLEQKIDVNGANRHPVYAALTTVADDQGTAGEVQWNFEKFVVSPDGEVVARFRPPTDPEAPELVAAIERALQPEEA